jgi:phospholipase A1
MSKGWELDPADKRGTFVVRTYLPNYFLPAHYTSRINRAPASPTHPAVEGDPGLRPIETKLQISLRAKIVEGLVLPGADLWFGYTQRSFWQLWSPQDSSPFRSTDYQPEMIYVVPIPEASRDTLGGWRWRYAELGIAHQSNGQRASLSRSWNRAYVGGGLEHGEFGLQLRAHRRIGEPGEDDNPDLTDYIGHTELTATWRPGLATASLTWRTSFASMRRGSVQLDWTYPVLRATSTDLRWYAQVFSGYGETLLDYNHRQTSIGLGVSLFHF